jgi:hypothetical protein
MSKKIKKSDNYSGAKIDITLKVEAPLYNECLDWMNEIPDSRAATLDFWARGNFVRHLLYTRQSGRHPVLIPAAHTKQMDWAYRRLALAGVPVTFVYTGALAKPAMIQHWQPLDLTIDAGWGYIAGPKTIVENKSSRRFWPVLGCASLMPESVVEWLATEGGAGFTAGRLFIAPSKLIGLTQRLRTREIDAFTDIASGIRATEVIDTAAAALDLELPWIDQLPLVDFEKLLVDYQDEFHEFQAAFMELVGGYHLSFNGIQSSKRRLEEAIRELLSSERHARFRIFAAKVKASLTTFPITMGVLATAGAIYAMDPFAGATVIAAAGKQLRDLWLQAKAEARTFPSLRSPYRVLLRLGMSGITFGTHSAIDPMVVHASQSSKSLEP